MPEELFDIYDEHMNSIGTATRSETHSKGYWHRSFHCWLTRREGDQRYVRFQLRQLSKDTNPGCYDITVAGHLSAGETMRDAVRELEEELGVSAAFEQLVPLGQIREDTCCNAVNQLLIDREVSDIFAFVSDLPLSELRLQPDEVAGVYEAEISELLSLFDGSIEELTVHGVELENESGNGGSQLLPRVKVIRAEQFVPRENSYYTDVLHKLLELT